MVTLVGTQKDFSEALANLIELDFAAAASYQEAIECVKSSTLRAKLREFKDDHQRHIQECGDLLHKMGMEPPTSAGIKQIFTQGKILFAHLMGDKVILKALESNEEDTVVAYERLNTHPGKTEDASEILARGLTDEQRQQAWLEQTIEELDTPYV